MDFAAFYLWCVVTTGCPPPVEFTITRTSYGNTFPTHIVRREWGQSTWVSLLGAEVFWDSGTEQLMLKITPSSTPYPFWVGDTFNYDNEYNAFAYVSDWGMWRADQWAVIVLKGFILGMWVDLLIAPLIVLLRYGSGRGLVRSD